MGMSCQSANISRPPRGLWKEKRGDWRERPPPWGETNHCLHSAVSVCLGRVQHTESIAAARPHQYQHVLSLGHAAECILDIGRTLHWLAINFYDYIPRLQSRVVGRAAWLHLLDHRPLQIAGRLQLLAHFRSHVGQTNSPTRFALTDLSAFFAGFVPAAHRLQSDRDRDVLAIAHHLQMDGCPRILLSHHHLQLTRVAYFFSVDLGDYIADSQTRFGSGRIGLNLAHHRSHGAVHVEELRVVWSHVGNSDSHVAVRHLAILNQLFHRGTHDLRRNSESHPRERTRGRDEECVDPNHLAARVHQRTTGVARVNGRIRLNELPRLASVVRRQIGTVQRADDAACHREAESERITERQNGLAWMQLGGVAPGRVRQVVAVHFNDREVGQRICAYHLGGKNPAIAHGYANVGRAIDHVVVRDNVAVGRNDHATPQPMLDARLLRPHLMTKLLTELATEELPERTVLQAIRQIAFRHISFCP